MKLFTRHSSLVTLSALALCAAQTTTATDGRYREYVVGERAGGMGGAAVATAADVDAIFYNPAGLSKSQGDSLSLSANLYGFERYTTEGSLEWGADARSSTFVSVPSALGGVTRFSDEWVGGIGVFTPKMEERHLVSASPERTGSTHLDYNDQTLWIGPAAAWTPAGSRFSFGAGIFAVYRDYSVSVSSFKRNDYTISGAADLEMLGALATLGVQVDLGDGWSAGAAVQTPSVRIWDDGKLSLNSSVAYAPGYDLDWYTTDVRADNYIPWQISAGVGKAGNDWGVELDAIWHPSAHYDLARWNIDGVRAAQALRMHSVFDVSLGGEYIVAERFPIRAGFYTAMSAVRIPEDTGSAQFFMSDVDVYGVTFSVGRRGDNMSVNLGVDCAFGNGQDLDYGNGGEKVRVDSDRCVILAIVSTTYYF